MGRRSEQSFETLEEALGAAEAVAARGVFVRVVSLAAEPRPLARATGRLPTDPASGAHG